MRRLGEISQAFFIYKNPEFNYIIDMNEPTITCSLIISFCMLLYIGVVAYIFKDINDYEIEKRNKYIEERKKEHEAWMSLFDGLKV